MNKTDKEVRKLEPKLDLNYVNKDGSRREWIKMNQNFLFDQQLERKYDFLKDYSSLVKISD